MKVNRKTSDQVSAAIIQRLKPIASRVKTITYDNGKEFASHRAIDQSLGTTAYFADPFASWRRGSNKNYNDLLRQYIPKKRHLSTVTDEELKMIEDRLNHRPRKRLELNTPHQVFHESLKSVALRIFHCVILKKNGIYLAHRFFPNSNSTQFLKFRCIINLD
jgi:IS30 family transposase